MRPKRSADPEVDRGRQPVVLPNVNSQTTHKDRVAPTVRTEPSEPRSARRIFATVPAYGLLTDEQRDVVEAGGPYPINEADHLPEHESLLAYFIDRSVDAWIRSQG